MSTPSNFAEFLGQLGHKVSNSGDFYAYDKNRFAWLGFPFHIPREHNSDVAKVLNADNRTIFLRYSEPIEGNGIESHRIICDDQNYEISSLSSRARTQTRRGLENCIIREIQPIELKTVGFSLFHSTRTRQGRPLNKRARTTWERYCDSANKIEGFGAWGAWCGNDLAALLIGFQMGHCFNILRQASDNRLVKQFPNNALVYQVTKQIIRRQEIKEISYGLAPIATEVQSLDNFKQRMGYRALPIRQNVASAACLKPFLPALSSLSGGASRLLTRNEPVRHVHSMLRVASGHKS